MKLPPTVGQCAADVLAEMRSAPGAVVLRAPVDVVGIAHVDAYGVELADREIVKQDEGFTVIVRQRKTFIFPDVEAVSVCGVNPHGVIIESPFEIQSAHGKGLAPVLRKPDGRCKYIDFLVIRGVDENLAVVEGTVVVAIHKGPGLAAVFGSVDAGAKFFQIVVIVVVFARLKTMFNDGHEDLGVSPVDGQADSPCVALRETAR